MFVHTSALKKKMEFQYRSQWHTNKVNSELLTWGHDNVGVHQRFKLQCYFTVRRLHKAGLAYKFKHMCSLKYLRYLYSAKYSIILLALGLVNYGNTRVPINVHHFKGIVSKFVK